MILVRRMLVTLATIAAMAYIEDGTGLLSTGAQRVWDAMSRCTWHQIAAVALGLHYTLKVGVLLAEGRQDQRPSRKKRK